MQETRVWSWVGKIPWRRKWQPTPVFLSGKSCGQGTLEGYGSWDHKRLSNYTTTTTTPSMWWWCGGLVAKLCLALCSPVKNSLPASSVHGIFQGKLLEWVAISFSRGSSPPRDRTWVSCIAGRFFTNEATREACLVYSRHLKNVCWLNAWLPSQCSFAQLGWELIFINLFFLFLSFLFLQWGTETYSFVLIHSNLLSEWTHYFHTTYSLIREYSQIQHFGQS